MQPSRLPTGVPKKRKATHACVSCRALRTRCSGQQPCTDCAAKGIDCVLDPDNDKRTNPATRRRVAALEEDRDLFIRLLRTLRHKSPHVDGLLEYIVDKEPSLAEIRLYMDRHIPAAQLERSPELLDVYEGLRRSEEPVSRSAAALDIARLCDIPPFTGPARPWTTVIRDDGVFSHLISLFFTWDYAFFNWIPQDLFLKDLRSGNPDSLFCSPFLVNAILAQACQHSDYPEASSVPGDITTKGEHFWREAKRLLDETEDIFTLVTIQGIGVMYCGSSVMGKDRMGWSYACRAAKALPVLRTRFANGDLPAAVTSELLDYLEIGYFGVMCAFCAGMQRPVNMDTPSCSRLPAHQRGDRSWFPYPHQVDPSPAAHANCLLNHKASLGEKTRHLTNTLYGGEGLPPRADMAVAAEKCYNDLQNWLADLPECLQYTADSVPEILTIHMYFHTILMTTFAPLKIPVPDADPETAASIASAREKCITSARATSALVSIFRDKWGIEHDCCDMHWMSVAQFMLIDDLHDDEVSRDAFINLTKASMSLASRWLLPKGIVRQVQIATIHHTNKDQKKLPHKVEKLFKRFERRLWRPEDRQRFNSAYPNLAATLLPQDSVSAMGDDIDMDSFLETWNHFTLASHEESSASEGI